jgi:hypothetical protein
MIGKTLFVTSKPLHTSFPRRRESQSAELPLKRALVALSGNGVPAFAGTTV